MGGISNPSKSATYLGVVSGGSNIQMEPNFSSTGAIGPSIGNTSTTLNLTTLAGVGGGNRFINALPVATRSAVWNDIQDSGAGAFQWGSNGSFQPLAVGDANGGANTPNAGGFTIDLYAGIGNFYFPASNPAYFIGVTSTLGAISGQFSTSASDAVGILLDSNAVTAITNWQWIARRGNGVAQVTSFSPAVPASFGTMFAVRIAYPPNSDAGLLTVKQLTAPGVWTTLLANQNLTGIGPAKGTLVGPLIGGKNFVNSGNTNSAMFHRCVGVTDVFNVGSAF
jgi:hypothetical protein